MARVAVSVHTSSLFWPLKWWHLGIQKGCWPCFWLTILGFFLGQRNWGICLKNNRDDHVLFDFWLGLISHVISFTEAVPPQCKMHRNLRFFISPLLLYLYPIVFSANKQANLLLAVHTDKSSAREWSCAIYHFITDLKIEILRSSFLRTVLKWKQCGSRSNIDLWVRKL